LILMAPGPKPQGQNCAGTSGRLLQSDPRRPIIQKFRCPGTRIGDWSSSRPVIGSLNGNPPPANPKACRLLLSKIQRHCRLHPQTGLLSFPSSPSRASRPPPAGPSRRVKPTRTHPASALPRPVNAPRGDL